MSAGGIFCRTHLAAAVRSNRCQKALHTIAGRTAPHMLGREAASIQGKQHIHCQPSAIWHLGRTAYATPSSPRPRSHQCRTDPGRASLALSRQTSGCKLIRKALAKGFCCVSSASTEQRSEAQTQNGAGVPRFVRRTTVKDVKVLLRCTYTFMLKSQQNSSTSSI